MTDRSNHETIVELLPWFVNGTLEEKERALVEVHVHQCVQCYAMLREERRLHEGLGEQSEARLSSSEHGFERLRARLDDGAAKTTAQEGSSSTLIWPHFRLLVVTAGGLAAIGLLAIVFLGTERVAGPVVEEFETLTGPAVVAARQIDVIFAADLSEADMRSVLQAHDAVIVGGPTDIGRYTIQIDGVSSGSDLDGIIDDLREDPRIRFVGRSYVGDEAL